MLFPKASLLRPAATVTVPMRFKTHFKRNLRLFERIVEPGTVKSGVGSVNLLQSSSVVSWSFCSEFWGPVEGLSAPTVAFYEEIE